MRNYQKPSVDIKDIALQETIATTLNDWLSQTTDYTNSGITTYIIDSL